MGRYSWARHIAVSCFDKPLAYRNMKKTKTLCEVKKETPLRVNEVGIQMLPEGIYKQLFPLGDPKVNFRHKKIAEFLLKGMGLDGQTLPPVADLTVALPKLLGGNVLDHLQIISSEQVRPYLECIKEFYVPGKPSEAPKKHEWQIRPGWVEYKYDKDKKCFKTRGVPYPEGNAVVLDTEVFYKLGIYPAIAVAISHVAWYLWTSPQIVKNYRSITNVKKYHHDKGVPNSKFMFNIIERFNLEDEEEQYERDNYVFNVDEEGEIDTSLPDDLFSIGYNEMKFRCATNDINELIFEEPEVPDSDLVIPKILVPLGPQDKAKVVVGHNVNYDRCRVLEEYNFDNRKSVYLDTLSLHNSVGSLSMSQLPKWIYDRKVARGNIFDNQVKKEKGSNIKDGVFQMPQRKKLTYKERLRNQYIKEMSKRADDLSHNYLEQQLFEHGAYRDPTCVLNPAPRLSSTWLNVSSPGRLEEAAKIYIKRKLDKGVRDLTATTNVYDACKDDNLRNLIEYCASDVDTTFHMFRVLFVLYRFKCPHPASLAATMTLSKPFLCTSTIWNYFDKNSGKVFKDNKKIIEAHLYNIIKEVSWAGTVYPEIRNDPHLRHLNWNNASLVSKKKYDRFLNMYKFKRFKGPKWLMDMIDTETGKMDIKVSSFVITYLLRLKFDNYYMYFSRHYGWSYMVPKEYYEKNPHLFMIKGAKPGLMMPLVFGKAKGTPRYEKFASNIHDHYFFRIPNPEGGEKYCSNPFSKNYTEFFEEGRFTSDYEWLNTFVNLYHECTLWTSIRKRVRNQFVIWEGEDRGIGFNNKHEDDSKVGVILPDIVPAGTLTRRVVDPTWLTAPSAEPDMLGSELKSCIRTPKNYYIIGSDVDSEELWISTLMGDSQLGIHGGTPAGFMTLQGDRMRGTDMHTLTARTLHVNREEAKIYNYARFYGASEAFIRNMMLTLHSDTVLPFDASIRARTLIQQTKGIVVSARSKSPNGRISRVRFWTGGSESHLFNAIEGSVESVRNPCTIALGCIVPSSLLPSYIGSKFARTRHNWIIQSSGVDYLHILITNMNYLMRRLNVDGRYMISVHDEIRFMVAKKDIYRALLALQVANLWTRTMFSLSVGIEDLPIAISFFSDIDVDTCLRKDPEQSVLTPSNNIEVPLGRKYNIGDLISYFKFNGYKIDNSCEPDAKEIYGEELPGIEREVRAFANARQYFMITQEFLDYEKRVPIPTKFHSMVEGRIAILLLAQSCMNSTIAQILYERAISLVSLRDYGIEEEDLKYNIDYSPEELSHMVQFPGFMEQGSGQDNKDARLGVYNEGYQKDDDDLHGDYDDLHGDGEDFQDDNVDEYSDEDQLEEYTDEDYEGDD